LALGYNGIAPDTRYFLAGIARHRVGGKISRGSI
jgi:hypothetical protein